ncbi:AI-2E family transporter [bacterium]|nr:MAG: AI-2E family transporter [bacterium]
MNRLTSALQIVALLLGIALLLWMLGVVLARIELVVVVLMISVLFSYLIYPVVKLLARRMPRSAAVLLVYAAALLLLTLFVAYIAPVIGAQANELARAYPQILAQVQRSFSDPQSSPLLRDLPPQIRGLLAENAGRLGQEIGSASSRVAGQTITVLTGAIHAVVGSFLVLVISFFLIADLDRIQDVLFRAVPKQRREVVISFAGECDQVIGGFIRGQVIVATVVGMLATIIMLLTHVKYALLLGLITGIADVVPYVGAVAGAAPAVIISLLTFGWAHALLVLALFVLMYEAEGHFIAPTIVGHSVGLSPLAVLIALLVGGEAFGLIGLLLAVPVAGILRIVLLRLFPPSTDGARALEAARAAHAERSARRG